MNPTLEQIKTDESVWPQGATHWISGNFHKYAGNKSEQGQILNANYWEDYKPALEYFEMTGATIIPRPAKAFVPEVGDNLESTWGKKSYWYECVILPNGKIALLDWINEVRNISELPDIEFRPIKSECELFIEAAIDCHSSVGHSEERMLKAMYDSGKFKLVEPVK